MPAIAPATIAELARKSGVEVASIRLHGKTGLLPKPRRCRGRTLPAELARPCEC